MAQRWLIGLGSLFLLLGILLLATTVARPLAEDRRGQAAAVSGPTESLVTEADGATSPSWSAAGGLSLAVGAGLIGIGMNRWRRHDHPGGGAVRA
jgi:hypothetical protein